MARSWLLTRRPPTTPRHRLRLRPLRHLALRLLRPGNQRPRTRKWPSRGRTRPRRQLSQARCHYPDLGRGVGRRRSRLGSREMRPAARACPGYFGGGTGQSLERPGTRSSSVWCSDLVSFHAFLPARLAAAENGFPGLWPVIALFSAARSETTAGTLARATARSPMVWTSPAREITFDTLGGTYLQRRMSQTMLPLPTACQIIPASFSSFSSFTRLLPVRLGCVLA